MERFSISQRDALEKDRYRQRRARQRAHRYQCMLGTVLVLLLSVCGALVVFILYLQGKISVAGRSPTHVDAIGSDTLKDDWCETSCMTPQCVETAAHMLEMIDQSVNPCVDFYQFCCGNFLENRVPPDDHYQNSIFQTIENEILIILKKKLESSNTTDSESVLKAKQYYESCLNTSNMEDTVAVLRDIFTEFHMGEWPLLEDHWDDSTFDLEQRLAVSHLLNSYIFFNVNGRFKNETTLAISLYRKGPNLNYQKYTSNKTEDKNTLEQYQKVLHQIFRVLGVPEHRREAEVNAIIDFETQYSVIYGARDEEEETTGSEPPEFDYDWPSTEHPSSDPEQASFRTSDFPLPQVKLEEHDTSYNESSSETSYRSDSDRQMTLSELQEKTPAIDWTKLMEFALPHYGLSIDDLNVYASVSSSDEYLASISTLIRETPPRTLANYINFQIVINNLIFMNVDLQRIYWENDLVFPKDYRTRRYHAQWKTCTNLVRKDFALVAAALYLQKNEKKGILEEVKKQFSEIKSLVTQKLKDYENLDHRIKDALINQLIDMEIYAGFPQIVLDLKKLDEQFKELQLSGNFLKNKFSLNILENKKILAATLDFDERSDENVISDPLEVNAFYSFSPNTVAIPLGLLRYPSKFLDMSRYLSYGSLGIVIGHEIMHGMTYLKPNRTTDKRGVELKAPEEFGAHRKCLAEQYSQYPIGGTGSKIDGNWTLNENFADNGALHYAFKAYIEYINERGEEPNLPGLRFNNKQMFFIVYGQLWCEVLNKKGHEKYLRDAHSPGKYRITAPVINSEDFSKAFNCPKGSPMNPEDRCVSWLW